jgi:hypothetical protein
MELATCDSGLRQAASLTLGIGGDCLAFQLAGKKRLEVRMEASRTIYTSTIE